MWFGRGMILGAVMFYFGILMSAVQIPVIYKSLVTDPINFVMMHRYLRSIDNSPYLMDYFEPVSHDYKGLVKSNESLMWGEYTFAASSKGSRAFILDKEGEIVHEWVAPIEKIWPDISHVEEPVPFHLVYFDRAFLSPEMNGDIYVTYLGAGDVIDSHYGLVKMDKDANVIWRYNDRAHHDIDFIDGDIVALVSEPTDKLNPDLPDVTGSHFNEYVVLIDSETGKEKKRVSVWDAFWGQGFDYLKESFYYTPSIVRQGDILHPNTVTPIPDNVIGMAPMLTKNSVMISGRNHDLLFIIDLETEKVTWASYGPFKGQHSPRFLDNGHIMLFDNMGYKGRSRALEIDLNTMGEVWYFADEQEGDGFFSKYNSMVDPLPNENVLVTATHEGRIFEVTRDKEIVWDYYLPERIQDGEIERIPLIYSGKRYTKEQLVFLKRSDK